MHKKAEQEEEETSPLALRLVPSVGLNDRPDWDFELKQDEEKNPYPLARALVELGIVTPESYKRENLAWGRFCTKIMLQELHFLRGGHIEWIGPGLGRELAWLPIAVRRYHCSVALRDGSPVACEKARDFLRKVGLRKKVPVTETQLAKGWKDGTIDDVPTNAYYLSQVLEHNELLPVMTHLGEFLITPPYRKGQRRIVYIILPRMEDNPSGEVKWRNAKPPWDDQWREPLRAAMLGHQPKIEVIGTHSYFGIRKYTFFRISMQT